MLSINSFSCLQCFLNLSSCWPSCDRSLSCHLSCHLPYVRFTAQKAALANAALCQWPPASSLRAITNRAEAGACSEPPPRPRSGTLAPVPCPQQAEKPAWSPVLPVWRPCHHPWRPDGRQGCVLPPGREFPTSSAKASDKPPGLPGGASEPVPAVTPLPSCCSCWHLSLVTCSGQQRCLPTYRSAHLTKTQPLLPLVTSPKRLRRSHFRLTSPGGHLRLPPPPLPLALPLNQNHQRPSSAPHATHPQRPPFSREGFSLFPCRPRR